MKNLTVNSVTDYELIVGAPLAPFCFGFRARFRGPRARHPAAWSRNGFATEALTLAASC
jgi:hypothetical protein